MPSFDKPANDEARALCRQIARARGETWLTTEELHRLLQAADLRLAPAVVSHSSDEAAALARVFGFPVVAKIASARAVHKTDIGGVRLHLSNEQAVRTAYAELCAMAKEKLGGVFDGVLIQPMMTSGIETLVGLSQDPMFGPLIAFGLGGIHVELFRDVAFRIAPLTDRDADELMRSVRGFALLQGYRNQPPADVRAIARSASEDFLPRRTDPGTARAGVQSGDGTAGRSRVSDRRCASPRWANRALTARYGSTAKSSRIRSAQPSRQTRPHGVDGRHRDRAPLSAHHHAGG